MMWNWLVVGLYSGCTLVLFDGSPLLPTPSALWDLVDRLGKQFVFFFCEINVD